MYRRMIRFLQFGLKTWFVHQTQSLLHSALQGCFAWFEWAGLPFGVARGAVSQTREPQQRTYPTATEWAGSWMVVPWHLQALPFASDCENRRPEIRYSVFFYFCIYRKTRELGFPEDRPWIIFTCHFCSCGWILNASAFDSTGRPLRLLLNPQAIKEAVHCCSCSIVIRRPYGFSA